MASITKKVNRQGITKYYSDVNINKRRVRRYLGLSLPTAKLELKKLEYELLFSTESTEHVHSKLKPATLSFLTSLESSGVSTLHLKSIQGKHEHSLPSVNQAPYLILLILHQILLISLLGAEQSREYRINTTLILMIMYRS